MNEVLETMKNDEFRLQDIESEIRKLADVKNNYAVLSHSVVKLEKAKEEANQVKFFVERSLPMLVHLQMCEGLEVVAGEYLDKL